MLFRSRLRQRAPQIEAGDRLTAALMIDAAVLLDQATFAESIWEDRARKAEHRVLELCAQLREYTGDNHTTNAARSGTPSGAQDPSGGAIE